ncbi:MAG: cytochrome c biogenesis protein CcdA [Burkholderiaceae bacterium]
MLESLWAFFLLPVGLGLLGFIEPCSIGASLLFLKSVEGNPPAVKTMQAIVFTVTRALFIGALGAAAALIGAAFLQFQRGGYLLLGTLYVALGLIYLVGKAGWLMRTVGPRLARLSTVRGSAALAIFFGLNIPACSVPLLAAVLGSTAVIGAAQVWQGFFMLALFGLALSSPLLAALAFGSAQRLLERLAGYSERVPVVIGLLFIVLGAWSIYYGWAAPWTRELASST